MNFGFVLSFSAVHDHGPRTRTMPFGKNDLDKEKKIIIIMIITLKIEDNIFFGVLSMNYIFIRFGKHNKVHTKK